MTHLRTTIFVSLVALLLAVVQVTEKICEDRTGSAVANTSVWKIAYIPVNGQLNKLACIKGVRNAF